MKFKVRVKIENRLGAASVYSLRAVCTHLVERYSLKEDELEMIVSLTAGQTFHNADLEIKCVKRLGPYK